LTPIFLLSKTLSVLFSFKQVGLKKMPDNNSSLKKKIEGDFPEQLININKLINTLIQSFLKSESDYGAIDEIQTDINRIYRLVKEYIDKEHLDIFALKLDNRILLSKTGIDFENIYEVIKKRSNLQLKKEFFEIWDDSKNNLIHLIIMSLKKHFPIEYSTSSQKNKIIEKILVPIL
jgi:hypothetical protein